MKRVTIKFILIISLTSISYSTEFSDISINSIKSVELTNPKPNVKVDKKISKSNTYECYNNTCYITTEKTNVCSDGKKYDTSKKYNSETGRYEYKDKSLKKWAEYQRNLGENDEWSDPDHQNITATGNVDAIEVAYVVVPNTHRHLLRKKAKVCITESMKCIDATVMEIGPAFGEISVGAMMKLGLNAHPAYGQYRGRITYIFYTNQTATDNVEEDNNDSSLNSYLEDAIDYLNNDEE